MRGYEAGEVRLERQDLMKTLQMIDQNSAIYTENHFIPAAEQAHVVLSTKPDIP